MYDTTVASLITVGVVCEDCNETEHRMKKLLYSKDYDLICLGCGKKTLISD